MFHTFYININRGCYNWAITLLHCTLKYPTTELYTVYFHLSEKCIPIYSWLKWFNAKGRWTIAKPRYHFLCDTPCHTLFSVQFFLWKQEELWFFINKTCNKYICCVWVTGWILVSLYIFIRHINGMSRVYITHWSRLKQTLT